MATAHRRYYPDINNTCKFINESIHRLWHYTYITSAIAISFTIYKKLTSNQAFSSKCSAGHTSYLYPILLCNTSYVQLLTHRWYSHPYQHIAGFVILT